MPQIIAFLRQLKNQIHLKQRLTSLWNRGLASNVTLELDTNWPLIFIPIVLINQLLTPHLVWMVLFIVLCGMYGIAFLWVRGQAQLVDLERTQKGALLVAGDTLNEEFVLHNHSRLPVLWAEVIDHSELPGYNPGRVVSCDANYQSTWRTTAECRQRGLYRLGPTEVRMGDPFGLFSLCIRFDRTQNALIYPRVVQLPKLLLPHGDNAGSERRRRPYVGSLPSASVRHYATFDSLRFVHWRSTAHRSQLMVKELEQEPGGDVWIVLDLDRSAHRGEAEQSTLETAIIAAASLAAELLTGNERRAVGLLTVSGSGEAVHSVQVPPLPGSGQLWSILAALAPVQPTDHTLADVLRQQRALFGRRRTVIVIAPVTDQQPSWLPALLDLRSAELAASVLWIVPSELANSRSDYQAQMARFEIPSQVLTVGSPMRSLLTFRRRRTELRTTPRGGTVVVEVEEEVG